MAYPILLTPPRRANSAQLGGPVCIPDIRGHTGYLPSQGEPNAHAAFSAAHTRNNTALPNSPLCTRSRLPHLQHLPRLPDGPVRFVEGRRQGPGAPLPGQGSPAPVGTSRRTPFGHWAVTDGTPTFGGAYHMPFLGARAHLEQKKGAYPTLGTFFAKQARHRPSQRSGGLSAAPHPSHFSSGGVQTWHCLGSWRLIMPAAGASARSRGPTIRDASWRVWQVANPSDIRFRTRSRSAFQRKRGQRKKRTHAPLLAATAGDGRCSSVGDSSDGQRAPSCPGFPGAHPVDGSRPSRGAKNCHGCNSDRRSCAHRSKPYFWSGLFVARDNGGRMVLNKNGSFELAGAGSAASGKRYSLTYVNPQIHPPGSDAP